MQKSDATIIARDNRLYAYPRALYTLERIGRLMSTSPDHPALTNVGTEIAYLAVMADRVRTGTPLRREQCDHIAVLNEKFLDAIVEIEEGRRR